MSNSKAIKAGFGYTIGNYLLKGFSFITVPIFARLLSTEDFGIYSAFVAYETILFIVLGCAIHSSYKNAKYRYEEQEAESSGLSYKGYVSTTMVMLLVNAIVLLVITNIFAKNLGELLDLNRLALNMLVLYSFSTAVINCFNADASLRYSYKDYLVVSVSNAVGNLACSVILILTVYSTQKYMGRIVGTVVPMLLVAAIACARLIRRQAPGNYREYLNWGLRYSIPIVFHGLGQVILAQFDRIMIRSIEGSAKAGIYSFGYTIFSIINVTFNSLDTVWSTWFYEKMSKNDCQAIKHYSTIYIYGILILCIFTTLICPELIIILGSEKYIEAKYCTIPILASGFFVFLYTLPASVEYYYEKTTYIAISTAIAAGINIALNFLLIEKYGYVAASYTTLFTYILYFIFHYVQAWKIEGDFIFSNATIVTSSFGMLLAMIVALLLLDAPVVRWGIAILLIVLSVLIEERRYAMLSALLRRLKNRG